MDAGVNERKSQPEKLDSMVEDARGLRFATVAGLLVLATVAAAGEPSGAKPRRAEYGLQRRVGWTTSRIKGSPDPPTRYVARRVFG